MIRRGALTAATAVLAAAALPLLGASAPKDWPVSVGSAHGAAGRAVRGTLKVAEAADGTPVELPIQIVSGERPGPIVWVEAATHGDEYGGVRALQELVRGLDPRAMSGAVVAVMITNPPAFRGLQRVNPNLDDLSDMGDVFPGRERFATERIAAAVDAEVRRVADAFVDLHTGGDRFRQCPFVFYSPTGTVPEQRYDELARSFGVPLLWRDTQKVFAHDAVTTFSGAGIPSFLLEVGGGQPLDPSDLRYQAAAVSNLLRKLGVVPAASGLVPAAVTISPAADLKGVLPGSKGPKVPPLADIYRAARTAFPGVPLGGGMYSFFTELNRKRPPAELLDFVTHTTCPIVHAADDRSVMETLEALPYVVQSTRAFIGKAAYRVGPSAIGARDNPYGAATAANPENRRICLAAMDPRQRGLFGAAWTLGYLAALARGGVSAVAIGAPTGPQGIVFRPADYPPPYFDKLRSAAVYPAYHVVAAFAGAAGRRQVAAESSDRSAVDAIAWQRPRGLTLWLANLTGDEQQVALSGLPSGRATLRRLDEDSFGPASLDPRFFAAGGRRLGRGAIALGPYAVASVDLDMD